MYGMKVLNVELGKKLFVSYNGAIRQAILRKIRYANSAMCGGKNRSYYTLYFGKQIGEVEKDKFNWGKMYLTSEDALKGYESVQEKEISPELFTSIYMKNTTMSAHCTTVGGYMMSIENQPEFYADYSIKGVKISDDGSIEFTDYNGNVLCINTKKYFKTEEECRLYNRPKVILLDE